MFSSVVLYLVLLGQALASPSGSNATNTTTTNRVNAAAENCTTYTVQSGDTCLSIAWANEVSYAQLVTWNSGIDSTCLSLASLDGDTICISNPNGSGYKLASNNSTSTAVAGATTTATIPSPTLSGSNADCGQWYEVESGQDCRTIELEFDISLDDFLFLNAEVWENCTNLQANVYYCVEPVGAISTYPGYGTTTATQTFVPTTCTSLPWVNITANYTTTNPVIPLANGTRTDCYNYLVLGSNNYENNSATNCWGTAMVWDVSPADFVLWNPSLDQNYSAASTALVTATASSDYTYPCTLSSSLSYCILLSSPTAAASTNTTAPSPRASGETANCTQWGYVYDFTDCSSLLGLYDLTLAELYAMNPSVGADCCGLNVGTYYCVSWFANGDNPDDWGYEYTDTVIATATSSTTSGDAVSTPSPVQTGIVSGCDDFYYVQQGDTCYGIAQDYSITLDEFYAWNPAVQDCADLEYGYYVCVGILASSSSTAAITSTITSTSTTSGVITPTPTQSGMVSGCDDFYDVESGNGCYDIAASYGIALTDFYSWNPAVSSCADLWPSYYVCVGVATAAGAAKRTVPAAIAAAVTTASTAVITAAA